mmetsp:Transcript_82673/g.256767  ORF Transcript_82673/g.256767 Transcript_82673/m.256767 type:complete len:219 (+) Transcript_82673:148-804(+)
MRGPAKREARLPLLERVRVRADWRRHFLGVGVVIEVTRVVRRLDDWLEGRRYRLGDEVVPIHVLEPLVLLDIVGATLQVAVALPQVRCEELLHQALGFLVEELGEDDLPAQDLLINLHRILVNKRGVSHNHLVDEDAEGPPVYGLPVALVEQDLWGNVLGRAAEGVRPMVDDLREAKVRELHVAVEVDENVLRLQVPVDYVLLVAVLEDGRNLRSVEA